MNPIKYLIKYIPVNGETPVFIDVEAKNYTSAYMEAIYKLPKGVTITEILAISPSPVTATEESAYSQMSLGDTLKQARIEKGWTLRDLAEIVGISHVAIHAYETEKSEPRITHLKWVAEALGLSIFDLIKKV